MIFEDMIDSLGKAVFVDVSSDMIRYRFNFIEGIAHRNPQTRIADGLEVVVAVSDHGNFTQIKTIVVG